MTAQPLQPAHPETGGHDVIRPGGDTAVVVPMAGFLRLQALELQASALELELEDAEDLAAGQQWRARERAGQTEYVPASEVRRRLGLKQ